MGASSKFVKGKSFTKLEGEESDPQQGRDACEYTARGLANPFTLPGDRKMNRA